MRKQQASDIPHEIEDSAWVPTPAFIATTNLFHCLNELNLPDVKSFHHWSTTHYADFWRYIIHKLAIVMQTPPQKIVDLSQGVSAPKWLVGATYNIVDSCFQAPAHATALIYQDANQKLCHLSFAALQQLTHRVANSLIAQGVKPGDAVAIIMPMHVEAIAIYLATIKMGCIVVSIADSFSSQEIAERLIIGKAQFIFTQAEITWAGKKLPLYSKITQIPSLMLPMVVCNPTHATLSLRTQDEWWDDFLLPQTTFQSFITTPMSACHILFSSGTTGTPKAIVWNHTTPIKAASDAFFHHNVQAQDVLAWPTNLGWMMGPWLIFAAFINRCAIALYPDSPNDTAFGQFIEAARVTLLGVVPTLVAHWHQTRCMENCDWSAIKVFSSTGECSNPQDMRYLMSLGQHKPIIEYCGGTEIGGAYLTSTVIEKNYPTLFSTPTMGLQILILDEQGKPAHSGEVALIPPSIGLSTTLLNADHQQVYFANMPTVDGMVLRRHGDMVEQLSNGYYRLLGRADDTMNLAGIKVSAVEIERALVGIAGILEVAAIAIAPLDHGPSQLIIYAATHESLPKEQVLQKMQQHLHQHLNPLFKIHDLVFVTHLPKTASNKIMRRILRQQYLALSS